jgi:hypothetical protein
VSASVDHEPTLFAAAASLYLDAGWQGVLPIPARQKGAPPTGFTGESGSFPTEVQLDAWRRDCPDSNIGLRMPADVIGIDVDAYGGKRGGETLEGRVAAWGALPATWISTSRDDGVSGIRFYRIPAGVKLIGSLPGIEIIQRHHRYAVVAPSIHPEGRRYHWVDPDGCEADVAYVDDLPELPAAWLEGLRADNKTTEVRRAARTGGLTTSPAVERALGRAVTEMRVGTRHDAALDAVGALARLEERGHPGASDAIDQLGAMFIAAIEADRGERQARGEWERMVDGARNLVATTPAQIREWEDRDTTPRSDDAVVLPAATPTTPWPDPSPLPEPPAPPAFPLEVLPTWAHEHVPAIASQLQVPVDLPAMLTIGSLAAAATGRAWVRITPNWSEPTNLFLVTAMRSGSGKSGAEKLAAGWIRKWQADRLASMATEAEFAEVQLRAARKALAKIEGGLDQSGLREAFDAVKAAENAMPPSARLLADDATPEAVATLLRHTGERLAIVSTEADLFDMVLKGKPGQRTSMAIYLKAWSGDQFIRDRKGGSEAGPEATTLDHPLLTVSITVQPSVLGRVQADEELVSRGFAARFMFAMPADLMGRRDQRKRFRAEHIATTRPYEDTATALANRWARWEHPADLRLAHDAAGALEEFLVELEPTLAVGGDHEHLAEWVSKLQGSVARYAGILHLAEGADPGTPIELATMERAITLGRYWLGNAVSVLALRDERLHQQAQAIIEWAAGHGAEFKLSSLHAAVRRPGAGLDKVADFLPPLDLLIELGWLRPVDDGDWKANVGVRRAESPHFTVWPECIGKSPTVSNPRKPRTASMGERDLSSPPCIPPTPYPGTRYAVYADNAEPPPVDNPAPGEGLEEAAGAAPSGDPSPIDPDDDPDLF